MAIISLVGGFAITIITVHSPLVWSSLTQSASGRLEIWSRAIWIVQDFPFTGVGMGLYGDVVEVLYPLFSFPPGEIPHAHNLFLQIAVDLGIPGLVVWLALVGHIGGACWCIYSHACRNNHLQAKVLATGQLCSGAALLIHGLVDAVTWGMVKPSILVWGIAGTIMATWRVQNESAN
jgi:putative inorganic carbon (HCO3(-)) transporter